MKIYAHRGASQAFPENTLPAFEEAIRLGVAGVELDILASADGVLVVTHDESLSRTFGVDVNVRETTYDEIHEHAPNLSTFEAVLDLIADKLHIDIELKQAGVERALMSLLARYPSVSWAISSFDWEVLRTVRSMDDECDLWLLSSRFSDDLVATARELGASTAALEAPLVDKAIVDLVAGADLKTMIWTVNAHGN